MSITPSSTMADVLIALNTRTVSTTGWSPLNPPQEIVGGAATAISHWSATVGLFGDDLTKFWENCATVGYTKCNPADHAVYSGWAVGASITVTTVLANVE